MEAELKKAFQKYDKNGDNFLTKKEIRDVLKQHDETFEDSDEEMFDEVDTNHDNKVSYQGKSYFCHFLNLRKVFTNSLSYYCRVLEQIFREEIKEINYHVP